MQEEKMITINGSQELALIGMYHTLVWDLRHNTRQTPPLKRLEKLFSMKFKNKYEAFKFLHELFKRNNISTIDVCDMGDCPAIKESKIPSRTFKECLLSWNTPNGITTNVVKLCKVCYEDMKQANAIIEEMS